MAKNSKYKDPVRELYLEKCTPEQHIEILQQEIKLTQEQMEFYKKNPLTSNVMKQRIFDDKCKKHIENKYKQINELKKKNNIQ